MAGEWQHSREELLELAKKRNVDPATHMALCGKCQAPMNAFGSVVHWGDCEATIEDIRFRPVSGK